MASDFFEQQDKARKRTGRLVLLFAAAVVVSLCHDGYLVSVRDACSGRCAGARV